MSHSRDRRLARVFGNRSGDAVFLCFHSVAPQGMPFLSVDPALFERQLAELRRSGLQGGGHEHLAELAGGARPSRPLVFLTFDDGYVDNYTHAFPLLREYGFKAILYVIPPCVDDGGEFTWPELAPRKEGASTDLAHSLTWEMVEEMAASGVEFGSHTNSHAHLDRLEGEAAECGYTFGFTAPSGAQREATPLTIPVVSIDHRDDERLLRLKLTTLGRRVLLSSAKQRLRPLRSLMGRG